MLPFKNRLALTYETFRWGFFTNIHENVINMLNCIESVNLFARDKTLI